MSTHGPQGGSVQTVYSDGLDVAALAVAAGTDPGEFSDRWWSSGEAYPEVNRHEVVEVTFRGQRLVNHIAFEVVQNPMMLRVQYLTDNGEWRDLTHPRPAGPRTEPTRTLPTGSPVRFGVPGIGSVVDRVPGTRPDPTTLHWTTLSARTAAVLTTKVRIIGSRIALGAPPVDPYGRFVPYALDVRNFSVGYRVTSLGDVPRVAQRSGIRWSSSKDLLGSRVDHHLWHQSEDRALDGESPTYWRSAPQPVPEAVVSLHLDTRDAAGEPTVVDRFWIDPVTTGVHCNVYYATEKPPRGPFRGLSDPVAGLVVVGDHTTSEAVRGGLVDSINFGPDTRAGFTAPGSVLRLDPRTAWWVGLDLRALIGAADSAVRPVLTVGDLAVRQSGGALQVVTPDGTRTLLALDPLHGPGTEFRLLLAYHPAGVGHPRIDVTYAIGGHLPVSASVVVEAPTTSQADVSLALDPATADVGALAVKGAVVKAEALDEGTTAWFMDEGEEFVPDALTVDTDRLADRNALLRLHPAFRTEANPLGVVGGANEDYTAMVWTPVQGSYALRKGYLHLTPTRARFWKFEFTGLVAAPYENFLPADQQVTLFPAHLSAPAETDSEVVPPGSTVLDIVGPWEHYEDSLLARQAASGSDPDATKVLVVSDPALADRAAQMGWIWSYQRWHTATPPRFTRTGVHVYDTARLRHNTKVAYFVGVKEISPARVDYAFADDTDEYVEHFLDRTHLDEVASSPALDFTPTAVLTTSATSVLESTTLRSYRTVRGVQFATQESSAVQVLEDPDFISANLRRWETYGDATLERVGRNDLLVRRGWRANTYRDIEDTYGTYGAMEAVRYVDLEGFHPTGAPEGGVDSLPYVPFGTGEISARVRLTAETDLTHPVTVEIVGVDTGVVLASVSRRLRAGDDVTLTVSTSGAGPRQHNTYGDVEMLAGDPTSYGALEAFAYAELESTEGAPQAVFVRVVQRGEGTDVFRVRRIGLYQAPIAWYFSNDDGTTWWQAVGIRNDPHGVLRFPTFLDTLDHDVGRTLRWRAVISGEHVGLSALHIRPWYGTRGRSADPSYGTEIIGPNNHLRDIAPPAHLHPMWQPVDNPTEHEYSPEDPFWRNLVTNPSGERVVEDWGDADDAQITAAPGALGAGVQSIRIVLDEEEAP